MKRKSQKDPVKFKVKRKDQICKRSELSYAWLLKHLTLILKMNTKLKYYDCFLYIIASANYYVLIISSYTKLFGTVWYYSVETLRKFERITVQKNRFFLIFLGLQGYKIKEMLKYIFY